MGETSKAHARRLKEGFYDTYCTGKGIDIGSGSDPLIAVPCRHWDKPDGDCTFMAGVVDSAYDFVYASHVLEHLNDPVSALQSWWRILSPGGCILISIPHRDLYEKKKELPSLWNPDHRTFWLPFTSDPPCTFSFLEVLEMAVGHESIISIRVCDAYHTVTDPLSHSDGEYSIEGIVRKPR